MRWADPASPAHPPPSGAGKASGAARPEEQPPSRALRAGGGGGAGPHSVLVHPRCPLHPPLLSLSWPALGGLGLEAFSSADGGGGGSPPRHGAGQASSPEAVGEWSLRLQCGGVLRASGAIIGQRLSVPGAAAAARHLSQRPCELSLCAAAPTPTAGWAEGPPRARVEASPPARLP